MYDGASDIQDEVRQNARDQQHPVTFMEAVHSFEVPVTQELHALPPAPKVIPGLSKRQMDLINNKDDGQPDTGAARERRLEIIYRDIASINQFLPKMVEVREYLNTMPHNDDEHLMEALAMADLRLRQFLTEIWTKLASLETELDLKKAVV